MRGQIAYNQQRYISQDVHKRCNLLEKVPMEALDLYQETLTLQVMTTLLYLDQGIFCPLTKNFTLVISDLSRMPYCSDIFCTQPILTSRCSLIMNKKCNNRPMKMSGE